MDADLDSGGTTTKPYHTKRPHKKSRAGCKNCKARKVKCNEARPACSNCLLRRVNCIYPLLSASAARASTVSQHSPSPSQSPALNRETAPQRASPLPTNSFNDFGSSIGVIQEPLFVPQPIGDAVDLKLMWFYTTHTFSSFLTGRDGARADVDDILKVKIPGHAFRHPFLMDTILGLAAIQMTHKADLHKVIPEIQPQRILRYRARAFEGYRRAVENATPDTYPALLACSLLLIGIASQTFRESDGKDLFILDWMVLWRGIAIIFTIITPKALWESGMVQLFFRPPGIDLDQSSLHIPNSLLFLVATPVSSVSPLPGADEYDTDDNPEATRTAYYQALQFIGSLYRELRTNTPGPRLNLRVLTWFTFLPERFIKLASARRPRALLIMSHYLMFVKLIQHIWWTMGIADREIPSISHYLLNTQTPAVRAWAAPHLAVPLAVVQAQSTIEIVRIILEDPTWDFPSVPPPIPFPLQPPFVNSPEYPPDGAEGPFLVNQKGKLAKYNPEKHRFIEVGSPPQLELEADQARHQPHHVCDHSPTPSASTSSTMETQSPISTDLDDVAMDKLHLDSSLNYGSLDIVLGGVSSAPH